MNANWTDRVASLTKRIGLLSLLVVVLSLTGVVAHAERPPTVVVDLGTATSFAILGASTVTNTGATLVTGNLGVSPGSAITGFPLGVVIGEIHTADAVAQQAQDDVSTAYNTLARQACNTALTGQDLGGLTLTEGVYCFDTTAQLTGQLTLDAEGDPNAVWVFQVGTGLNTAPNASILIVNGGNACNVAWQVGSSATLDTGNRFAGNILALASISLGSGTAVTGRALAQTGAVTLDTNASARPLCGVLSAVELSDVRVLAARQGSPTGSEALGLGVLGLVLLGGTLRRTQQNRNNPIQHN